MNLIIIYSVFGIKSLIKSYMFFFPFYITCSTPINLRNSIILLIFASGPSVTLISFSPIVALLCWATSGHSCMMCFTVSWTLHPRHTDGRPLGLSIRWQWVNRVWPILSLVMITSSALVAWLLSHCPVVSLILLSLFAGGCASHILCHFLHAHSFRRGW